MAALLAGDAAAGSATLPAAATRPVDVALAKAGLARGKRASVLTKLRIGTVGELLFHLPRRYDDFSRPKTLRELRQQPPDGPASATVEIVDLRVEPGFRRRVQRTVARVRDATGEGEAVWFGRRYIERRIAAGQIVALAGRVELRGWLPRFQNPDFGPAGDAGLHAGRIVPVYRLTAGITLAWLRAQIRQALNLAQPAYPEYLPETVRQSLEEPMIDIGDAVEWVHFPRKFEDLNAAHRRLAFDELFALQLGMVARDRQRRRQSAEPVSVAPALFEEAIATVERVLGEQIGRRRARLGNATAASADVVLTVDQRSALDKIREDLMTTRPMNRLLQGDVGSGKTAVAALALAFVADGGRQGALLAPTDLLARQHAQTLAAFLEPLGHGVTLLTGSLSTALRRSALELIQTPLPETPAGLTAGRVIVGTHALVQERVAFQDLSLVVVDEQHRFGVAEREALTAKGRAPHVLLMTATPIPRTLGQIVHADLDVSDLRTPPAGRTEIRTAVRTSAELVRRRDGRPGALAHIVREVGAGRRAFVVVPLVEDDEDAGARSVDQAAALVREHWSAAAHEAGVETPDLRLEIVHGQLNAAERDQRMERFREGAVQVLVGTTVLEVGVDVPEASVMLIFDADRFGLAQLHQLRGRVGRGEVESVCVLVSDRYPVARAAETEEEATVKARLDAIAATQDGFALAELDLDQRREGDLLGLSQSGLPPLRVASLHRPDHRQLSISARRLAETLLDDQGRLPPDAADLEHELAHGWLARVGAGEVVSATAGA